MRWLSSCAATRQSFRRKLEPRRLFIALVDLDRDEASAADADVAPVFDDARRDLPQPVREHDALAHLNLAFEHATASSIQADAYLQAS